MCLCVVLSLLGATTIHAQDVGFANAWPELDAQGREQVMRYAEDFKTFLGKAKSEMQFVREATRFAEAAGFRKWDSKASGLKPGRARTPSTAIARSPLRESIRTPRERPAHRQHPHRLAAIEFKARPFAKAAGRAHRHPGSRRHQELSVGERAAGDHRTRGQGRWHDAWIDVGNDPADPVAPDLQSRAACRSRFPRPSAA